MTTQVLLNRDYRVRKEPQPLDYTQQALDPSQYKPRTPLASNTNGHDTATDELKQLLDNIKIYFYDLTRRTAFLQEFTRILSTQLWQEYKRHQQAHHSLIFSLQRGISKVNFTDITEPQLVAFEYGLEMLEQPTITVKDLFDCRRRFRTVGIETRMDWGEPGAALADLYKEEI